MRRGKSKLATVLRVLPAAVACIMQVALFAFATTFLHQYAAAFYTALQIVSVALVIYISSRRGAASYKAAWTLIILLLSVFGAFLYFAWGNNKENRRLRKKLRIVKNRLPVFPPTPEGTVAAFESEFPEYIRASRHLRESGFPLCGRGHSQYYPSGESFFEALKSDMLAAKQYIFLEYFIIADGKIWESIHDILVKKVAEGVEVRVLYDDGGSLFTIHSAFRRELEEGGIKVRVFSPVHKLVSSLSFNYRNHRKIAIVDGRIGYTGGINIGDEYANLYPKLGHWKDTAIRLHGEVVTPLLLSFLEMWGVSGGAETAERAGFEQYISKEHSSEKGYYQFFSDGPANNPLNPAEDAYLSILGSAKDYVYITSPYLIIDDAMEAALINAAESGVDVRIVTPKQGDRWYVHATTRSFYGRLLRYGVRIFEYTPGFIHAKMLVSDDRCAIIGTVNMDFRSFFLHYECAVLTCGTETVMQIRNDIDNIFSVSEEILLKEYIKRPARTKILESILHLFSPLM